MGEGFSHLDAAGQARMVDISTKAATERMAVAQGRVLMSNKTLALILDGEMPKGDVLAAARVAGIMAAKQTSLLVPLCHPLAISAVSVDFIPRRDKGELGIQAQVKTTDRTGVEMEALTAVSIAALTIYDMCKAVERGMVIDSISLIEKKGGRSGHYQRKGEKIWGEL